MPRRSWRAQAADECRRLDEVKDFFDTVLADGPVQAVDVLKEAEDAGSPSAHFKRYKGAAGIESARVDGAWFWQRKSSRAKGPLATCLSPHRPLGTLGPLGTVPLQGCQGCQGCQRFGHEGRAAFLPATRSSDE